MPKASGHTSTYRRNVAWLFMGSTSQAALGGVALLLLGRLLGAERFGGYSVIMGFVYVANLLVEPRMQDVAARQFSGLAAGGPTDEDHRNAFLDLLLLEIFAKLLPCAGLLFLSAILASAGHLPQDASVLICVAATGYLASRVGWGLSTGLLRVLGRTQVLVYCNTGELLLRIPGILLLGYTGHLSIGTTIGLLSLTGMLANALQLAVAIREARITGACCRRWRHAGLLSRLSVHRRLVLSNIGLSASDLMNKDLDVTLLAPILPAAEIGIYKMAKNVALLTWRAVDPVYLALMPEINRLVCLADYGSVRRLIRRSAAGLAALSLALSAIAFVGFQFLGQTVLGVGFAQVPAIMLPMLAGVCLGAPLVWGHPLAVAFNRAEIAFLGSLTGSLIGLITFLILAPRYGTQGAALAWSVTFVPGFALTAAASLRQLPRS